jgi:hypothetical protein
MKTIKQHVCGERIEPEGLRDRRRVFRDQQEMAVELGLVEFPHGEVVIERYLGRVTQGQSGLSARPTTVPINYPCRHCRGSLSSFAK